MPAVKPVKIQYVIAHVFSPNKSTCVQRICSRTRHVLALHLTSMLPPLVECEVALPYFLMANMCHDQCRQTPLKTILVA